MQILSPFPVYRTYITPNGIHDSDRVYIEEVIRQAKEQAPLLQHEMDFIEKLMLLEFDDSLSQTLLKIAAPGVPDFYQGTELWELSLVDPDNRRPPLSHLPHPAWRISPRRISMERYPHKSLNEFGSRRGAESQRVRIEKS